MLERCQIEVISTPPLISRRPPIYTSAGIYQPPTIIRGIARIANENASDYASGITDGPQSRMEFVRESRKCPVWAVGGFAKVCRRLLR